MASPVGMPVSLEWVEHVCSRWSYCRGTLVGVEVKGAALSGCRSMDRVAIWVKVSPKVAETVGDNLNVGVTEISRLGVASVGCDPVFNVAVWEVGVTVGVVVAVVVSVVVGVAVANKGVEGCHQA